MSPRNTRRVHRSRSMLSTECPRKYQDEWPLARAFSAVFPHRFDDRWDLTALEGHHTSSPRHAICAPSQTPLAPLQHSWLAVIHADNRPGVVVATRTDRAGPTARTQGGGTRQTRRVCLSVRAEPCRASAPPCLSPCRSISAATAGTRHLVSAVSGICKSECG